MVFKAKGSHTFKLRVDHPDGRHAVLSTGCQLEEDADEVEAAVRKWQGKRGKKHARLDIIDGLIEKRYTLARASAALEDGTLEELVDAHPPAGVDLTPRIAEWIAEKRRAKRGAGQADAYEKQLGVLFPERPLLANLFTRRVLWERLDRLEVEDPTKNRYRACASSFAKYLVKREIIERNFVRDIEGWSENDPRVVYYEIPDAKRLIGRLAQPHAAIAAAALGFCMEWGALDRAIVSDFDLKSDPITAHVRGSKRSWRDRVVPLVPELAWIVPYLKPALSGKMPTVKAFDDVPEWRAIDRQRAAANEKPKVVAVGEEDYGQHSIHDWRHTHAVALLRWGYSEQIAADHLGHKDTSMVRKVYGRFKATKLDYAKGGTTVQPAKGRRAGKR